MRVHNESLLAKPILGNNSLAEKTKIDNVTVLRAMDRHLS